MSTSSPCSKVGSTSSVSVAPASSSSSAPSNGVAVATGDTSPSNEPRNTRAAQPSPETGAGCVVREARVAVPRVIGQRHPQLDAVQHGRAGQGHLGVADAAPGGHQVQLAGTDRRVVPVAVAVLDLAGEEPAHGLQPGVRVRRDRHPAGVRDGIGPVVVGEAPGADQRPLPRGQGAPDLHGPQATEGHHPRGDHLDPGRASRLADDLGGVAFGVAHGSSVPRAGVRSSRRRRGCPRRRGRGRPTTRRTPGPRPRGRPRRARAARRCRP